MNNQGFESFLTRLFKQDFSAGTETFREELLTRCLGALGADGPEAYDPAVGMELTEDDLDLLAAAGNAYALQNPASIDNRTDLNSEL